MIEFHLLLFPIEKVVRIYKLLDKTVAIRKPVESNDVQIRDRIKRNDDLNLCNIDM